MQHYRLVLERDDDPDDIIWMFETEAQYAAALAVAKQYDCGLNEERSGAYEFDQPNDAIEFIKEVYEAGT